MIHRIFCTLLQVYKGKELQYALPVIFKLEEQVKEKKLAPHLALAIHSINAFYLIRVSQLYNSQELEEYIRNEVMASQEKPSHWGKVFSHKGELLTIRKNKFK